MFNKLKLDKDIDSFKDEESDDKKILIMLLHCTIN